MANTITESNLSASNFVDPSSRYVNSDVIYYGDDHLITFKTYVRGSPSFSPTDKFYLINQATQYRPDLVSYFAYGTPYFWWRIMEANGIYDISKFTTGTTIRIPNSVFGG